VCVALAFIIVILYIAVHDILRRERDKGRNEGRPVERMSLRFSAGNHRYLAAASSMDLSNAQPLRRDTSLSAINAA